MPAIRTREGYAPFRDFITWYRITGDPVQPNRRSSYSMAARVPRTTTSTPTSSSPAMAAQVIHYDQLGCGKSTLLPDKGVDFWTPRSFRDELNNLIDHLGHCASAYHVLGQSWGGMLGAEFGITRPAGLKSLTIANSPASMELWVSEANRLRSEMPEKIRSALDRHEKAGTVTDPEYAAATMAFYERHVCRVVPFPPEVKRSFDQIGRNPTVYNTMNGPNEFFVIGSSRPGVSSTRSTGHQRADAADLRAAMTRRRPRSYSLLPTTSQARAGSSSRRSSHLPHVEETRQMHEDRRGIPRRERLETNIRETSNEEMVAGRRRGPALAAPQRPAYAEYKAEHRGGTMRLVARSAGRHARPAHQLHAAILAALSADSMTVSSPSRRRTGADGFTIVPDLAEEIPAPDNRRQDLCVQDPQGHQVLRRPANSASRTSSPRFQRIFKVSSPTSGCFYRGDRRRRQMPRRARRPARLKAASSAMRRPGP